MNRVLLIGALVVAAGGCGSESTGIDWATTEPSSGTVTEQGPGGHAALRLDGAGTHRVVVIELPGVADQYAVTGQVRFQGVDFGYLEMWSAFESEGRFFTRTLAADGPLQALSGDSDWREFTLPFNAEGLVPDRLEINLVLEGAGTVWLGPLSIERGAISSDGSAWGVAGGIAGTILGLLGALIGWLVSRGRGRAFALASLTMTAAAGLGLVVWGLWLVATSDGEGYPPLLIGSIFAVVSLVLIPTVRRRYEETELRRMAAIDAG